MSGQPPIYTPTDEARRMVALSEMSRLKVPLSVAFNDAPFDKIYFEALVRFYGVENEPFICMVRAMLDGMSQAVTFKGLPLQDRLIAWDGITDKNLSKLLTLEVEDE